MNIRKSILNNNSRLLGRQPKDIVKNFRDCRRTKRRWQVPERQTDRDRQMICTGLIIILIS